jgi:hypothetical protein
LLLPKVTRITKAKKTELSPPKSQPLFLHRVEALAQGKAPIQGIEDFNTTFSGLELSVADYETKSAEVLLVNAVFNALDLIYPTQVEIVNL